jgi:chromosome segregation ATPase
MTTEHPPEGQEPSDCDARGLARAEEALSEAVTELSEARADLARAEHKLEEAEEDIEHARDFWVIVNGRRKEVHQRHLSFREVVELAFPNNPPKETIIYTVTYRIGGDERRPEGTLVAGQSVKIKDGTIFDVTATDKS